MVEYEYYDWNNLKQKKKKKKKEKDRQSMVNEIAQE